MKSFLLFINVGIKNIIYKKKHFSACKKQHLMVVYLFLLFILKTKLQQKIVIQYNFNLLFC